MKQDTSGTVLLQGDVQCYGVGHNAVAIFNGTDYIIFHACDASDNDKSKLKIENWHGLMAGQLYHISKANQSLLYITLYLLLSKIRKGCPGFFCLIIAMPEMNTSYTNGFQPSKQIPGRPGTDGTFNGPHQGIQVATNIATAGIYRHRPAIAVTGAYNHCLLTG